MWVYVYSGLMSRCVTLAHAYYLLKKLEGGKNLTIIWPMEEACWIPFYDVFSKDMFDDIEVRVIELDQYYHKYGGIKVNLRKRNYGVVLKAAIKKLKIQIGELPITALENYFKYKENYMEYHPPKEVGWKGEPYLKYTRSVWEKLKNKIKFTNNIFIHAYCGIIKDEEEEKVDFGVVQFKREYWEKVKKIMQDREEWVGVHIRRTDHATAIEGSKTEHFVRNMKRICEQRDNVSFFLATDDIQEEKYLKKIFGNKIVTQNDKEWGRTTKEGMQAGVIDCLCLSCCEYILGSYTSVFSSFAARYAKKELVICKKIM